MYNSIDMAAMGAEQGDTRNAAAAWAGAAPNRRALAIQQQPDSDAHIRAFEDAMDELVVLGAGQPAPALGLALPFEPVERGESASYRRALKKYTNSVVFENIHLALLLVRAGQPLEVIAPDAVNAFLAGLNAHIAAFKKGNV
jgi:hypothetical protein